MDHNLYFLGKNNETLGVLDSQVALFRQQLQLTTEKLESENDRRVLLEDFKRGMKHMNDFLLGKFRE